MPRQASLITVAGITMLAVLVACDGNGSSAPVSLQPGAPISPPPSGDVGYTGPPRGLLAIGHSQLTGYHADPANPGDAWQFSWATGTSPRVDSIYQRLVAADPTFHGRVVNDAYDGATSDVLLSQAQQGLTDLPKPRLLLIQTIDNDIRCEGPPPSNLGQFGANIRAVLQFVVHHSPQTQIMMFSQAGRPATYAAAMSHNRDTRLGNEGTDKCAIFNVEGHLEPAHIRRLTAILASYETVERRECNAVPQCHYSAVLAHVRDTLRAYTSDLGHPSVFGARRFSAVVWPLVKHVLHLN